MGIDACCRTSVVYSPRDLSCRWELGRATNRSEYPDKVAAEVAAYQTIGANVLAYATGRQLRDKLEDPVVLSVDPDGKFPTRGSIEIGKLHHAGGSNEAPAALPNLLAVLSEQSKLRTGQGSKLISPSDKVLADYPILFMHGRRGFRFSAAQRKSLAKFFESGGFLFADSICANAEFSRSFKTEMAAIFPKTPLERVPADHELLTNKYRGFDVRSVVVRDPAARGDRGPLKAKLFKAAPLLQGIQQDGRYVVLFSPYDISCALENSPSVECKGYSQEDAAKLGTNIILYALQE